MVLFSGDPGPTGVAAPSPTQRDTVGDGYVMRDVKDGGKGIDVVIDIKPGEDTEDIVSIRVWDVNKGEVEMGANGEPRGPAGTFRNIEESGRAAMRSRHRRGDRERIWKTQ